MSGHFTACHASGKALDNRVLQRSAEKRFATAIGAPGRQGGLFRGQNPGHYELVGSARNWHLVRYCSDEPKSRAKTSGY